MTKTPATPITKKTGKQWLEDRKQRVQLNGQRSGWTEVRNGVP